MAYCTSLESWRTPGYRGTVGSNPTPSSIYHDPPLVHIKERQGLHAPPRRRTGRRRLGQTIPAGGVKAVAQKDLVKYTAAVRLFMDGR